MTNSSGSSRPGADWLVFALLGFFWGSSYLFIKIGVLAGLPPFTLVMFRLLIGSSLLATVVLIARERLPRERRFYAHISVVGFFGIALPFVLITYAETSVDSALAAVLTAPVPLFVIPFAALLLPDEGLTLNKVIGVVIGLIGVAVLVGFDPAQLGTGDFAAELDPGWRGHLVRRRWRLRPPVRAGLPPDDPGPLRGVHRVRDGRRCSPSCSRSRWPSASPVRT